MFVSGFVSVVVFITAAKKWHEVNTEMHQSQRIKEDVSIIDNKSQFLVLIIKCAKIHFQNSLRIDCMLELGAVSVPSATCGMSEGMQDSNIKQQRMSHSYGMCVCRTLNA